MFDFSEISALVTGTVLASHPEWSAIRNDDFDGDPDHHTMVIVFYKPSGLDQNKTTTALAVCVGRKLIRVNGIDVSPAGQNWRDDLLAAMNEAITLAPVGSP
jgi:hypothetical protein